MIIDYSNIFSNLRVSITVVSIIILAKYFIYLIIAPFYKVHLLLTRIKLAKQNKKYSPLVSIIVPAWNEEVGIITTLQSVLENTYKNIEVIVINDGSTDNTDTVVRAFIKQNKKIKYYYKKNGGKGEALNFGIGKSKGEIIMTMDADSAHHPLAVQNMVKYFQDPSVHALVGNVKITNVKNIVGLIQQFEYVFGFYFKRVHSILDAEYIFGGACAAFRKSTTFDKLGLFDTTNKTEDIEYSMRIKLNGLKSVYAEDVVTYTEGASDYIGLYKQRLRWKKGRIDTFYKYRKLFFSKEKHHSTFMSWIVLPYAIIGELQMLFEPLFFAAIWTYTFASGDYLSIGLSSLFILITYLAACVFGDKDTKSISILLFPFTWLMFYIVSFIEYLALLKSLEMVYKNQDIVWQSWARKGVNHSVLN